MFLNITTWVLSQGTTMLYHNLLQLLFGVVFITTHYAHLQPTEQFIFLECWVKPVTWLEFFPSGTHTHAINVPALSCASYTAVCLFGHYCSGLGATAPQKQVKNNFLDSFNYTIIYVAAKLFHMLKLLYFKIFPWAVECMVHSVWFILVHESPISTGLIFSYFQDKTVHRRQRTHFDNPR